MVEIPELYQIAITASLFKEDKMKDSNTNENTLTPFCNINEAVRRTGLSEWFIRKNIKDIPHCKSGKKYLVNVEGLMEYALKTGESA